MDAPIPLDAPVTIATLFSSLLMIPYLLTCAWDAHDAESGAGIAVKPSRILCDCPLTYTARRHILPSEWSDRCPRSRPRSTSSTDAARSATTPTRKPRL